MRQRPFQRATGDTAIARANGGRMARVGLSIGLLTQSAFFVFGSAACEGRRASAEECDRIFDRLVEVELAERGLHDPVLLQRRAQVLRSALAPERASCVGRPLPAAALDCIARAPNAEAVVHRCLK